MYKILYYIIYILLYYIIYIIKKTFFNIENHALYRYIYIYIYIFRSRSVDPIHI